MADTDAGSVAISITGDYSGLQDDFDAAAQIAEGGGEQIASALDGAVANTGALSAGIEGATSDIEDLGDSADLLDALREAFGETGEAAEGAAEGVHEVSEEAEEAGINSRELLETLLEFSGIELGIEATVDVLKDLGKESLEAYANTQRVEVALTAMTVVLARSKRSWKT